MARADTDVGKGPRQPLRRLAILASVLAALGVLLMILGVFDLVFVWVFTQPALSVPLAVLLLILYGLLGNGLGLSKLYLSTDNWTRFLAGLFSALLVAHILLVSYLQAPSLRATNEDFRRVLEIYRGLGIGTWLELPPPGDRERWDRVASGKAGIGRPSEVLWRLSAFLWVSEVPLLILMLVPGLPIELFEGVVIERPDSGPASRYPRAWRFGCWSLGLALGAIGAQVLLIAPAFLAAPLEGHLLARGGRLALNAEAELRVTTFATILAATATVLVGFALLRVRSREGIPAPVAINSMLALLATLYLIFTGVDHFSETYINYYFNLNINKYFLRTLVALGLLGWIGLANGHPWKLAFPGLEAYYPRGSRGRRRPPERQGLRRLNEPASWDAPEPDRGSGNLAILRRWARHAARDEGDVPGRKPKLAVVAVSGGALRSAIWTALMMERLEDRFERRFGRHIRLMTGASGGMLGAAAYVAGLWNPKLFDSPDPGGEEGEPLSPRLLALRRPRSLDAVAQQLALFDVPSILDPRCKDEDRGRMLEASWPYLQGISFGGLLPEERAGRLPSLVFSPMLVQDGRRLLISNLDLDFACKKALASDGGDGPGPPLSLPAVEFRRIFHERFPQFLVSTAVRMSATFPYVSPAVSLPTDPRRSVVDAGYYDGFGVNLACEWIDHPPHRRWLERNTSGVALIEIRDHLGREARTRFEADGGAWGGLGRSLDLLTDPLTALLTSRHAAAAFRNDGQVEDLKQHFHGRGGPVRPGFFNNIHLEFGHADSVALNWQLTDGDIEDLRKTSDGKDITRILDDLRGWWDEDYGAKPGRRG